MTNLNPSEMAALLDSVCDTLRQGVRQSNQAVLSMARRRLTTDPADRIARHVLAASSLAIGNPQRALDWLCPDGLTAQDDPIGSRISGYAYLVVQQLERARDCFDRAVRLDPAQPDCWRLLGAIAERKKQPRQAVASYERGVLFDDGKHHNTLALARLHARQRRLKEAIHALRICLLRERRHPDVNVMLAKLLQRRAMQLGRTRQFAIQQRVRGEALECCRVVNAAAPTVGTWLMQGRLQQQLFDFAGARASFQKAVDLKPRSAPALAYLAGSNVDFGDLDAAIGYFEQALAIDFGRAETHFRYTRAKRFTADKQSRRYVRQLLQQVHGRKQSTDRLIHWHYAIAKVYDDTGEFDLAWQHYSLANGLKVDRGRSRRRPKSTVTNGALLADVADRCEGLFNEPFFHDNRSVGNKDRKPIFIVGMPRSGTTLTEQILSSHPDIAGAGELQYINQIRHEAGKIRPNLFSSASSPSDVADSMLSPAEKTQLRQLADGYLGYLDQFRSSERFVTDKMPTNFMHLGLVALLFPAATVIHCRRDPLDVMVSCFCQNLNAPFCDLEALLDYHRSYRRLMRHWERTLPLSIHTVDYESLTADPETGARAMLAHCGLDWSDQCLQFHANDRAVHTPSKWQVRQPMYRSSVGKWRRFEKHMRSIADRIDREIRSESAVRDHCMSTS